MPLVLLFVAVLTADGPLPSHADRPYVVKVCLRFSDDPAFTKVFTEGVRRQVRDQLRNLFGALAEVEVIDAEAEKTHPWLVRHAGQELAEWTVSPADFENGGSEEKLFVFEIDYDGNFLVAWRQIDGDMQHVGPLRRRATADRPWLAKSICLAVKDDFAPVAVVQPGSDPANVAVEFRGSRTAGAAALATWLGDDCVLQPYWVVRQRQTVAHVPVPNTVLRMTRNGGLNMARVETNRAQPWKQSARIVGFRAMRLHTARGQIRLKLVNAETGGAVLGCQVLAGDRGFKALGDADRLPAADRDGYVISPKTLANVAYVRIEQGGGKIEFPMPLTGDWNEQVCKVSVDRQARQKSDLARQLAYLQQDVRALQSAVSEDNRRINGLNAEKRYEEALRASEAAVEFVKRFRKEFVAGLGDAERRGALFPSAAAALARLNEQSRDLAKKQEQLETVADNLRKAIAKNDAQNRANVLIELGRQALLQGDGEEVITKYEQALAEQPDQPALAKELATLKEVWRIKSPRHQEARDFVLKLWPDCELTDLERRLPEAEQTLAALRAVGDYLTLGRFYEATGDHAEDLADLIEQLAERGEEADRVEQAKYTALLQEIQKLYDQILAAISGAARGDGDASKPDPEPDKPASPPPDEEEE